MTSNNSTALRTILLVQVAALVVVVLVALRSWLAVDGDAYPPDFRQETGAAEIHDAILQEIAFAELLFLEGFDEEADALTTELEQRWQAYVKDRRRAELRKQLGLDVQWTQEFPAE